MRRIFQSIPQRYVRQSSFVAGLFNFKVVSGEMFPYPTRKFDSDESDNVQSLIEQIRSSDKELNTSGARIAAEYGGLGLSHTAHALVCEELGTSGDKALLKIIQHCGLASYLISTAGSKEQKGKYLTAMSDGAMKVGWATQEECGNDISMNITEAKAANGAYAVTGTKVCHFAEDATHFLVLAKTSTQTAAEGGPVEVNRNTFFIVDRKAAGVVVKGDSVTFTNALVLDVIGVIGEGFKDRMVTLFTEQYVYSAALLGTLKRVVQELRDSIPDRWATSAISSCACSMYAMESALYALTANLDLPTEDSLLEAAVVNAFIQSSANEWLTILSTAIPTTETLEQCFASARLLLAMMESCDFLNATAVCCGLEDFGLFFQKASTLQMVQARTLRSMGIRERISIREIDCSMIDAAIVNFGNAAEATFVRNTSRVPHQQLILNRLGEAAGLIYASSAAASRAAMCVSKRLPTAKTEKLLASTFMMTAVERANFLAKECRNTGLTADDSYKRIALELCEDALQ